MTNGSPGQTGEPPSAGTLLKTTRYEQSAAALITALILVGAVVVLLFLLWLTTRVWVRPTAIEPQLIEPLAGGGNAMSDARDLADPGDEDFEELEPALQDTLESITDIITTQQATIEAQDGDRSETARGHGAGDRRVPGAGDANLIPRWDRWEFRFEESTLAAYARQLDFFGIELAAVGGERSTIDYAYHLTKARPDRREGGNDSRIYLAWSRDDRLREADMELLRRAGIETANRQILKFMPPTTENQCAVLEDAEIKKRGITLQRVRRTIFLVVPNGDGYEFRVSQIQSR